MSDLFGRVIGQKNKEDEEEEEEKKISFCEEEEEEEEEEEKEGLKGFRLACIHFSFHFTGRFIRGSDVNLNYWCSHMLQYQSLSKNVGTVCS